LDLKGAGMNPHEALEVTKKKKKPIVDLKFVDLLGTWQHLSIPVEVLTETRI
jgi:glutamine synthetase